MFIQLDLQSALARIGVLLVSILAFGILVKIVTNDFIISVLSDNRTQTDTSPLSLATDHLPNSARLLARLAESEIKEAAPNLESAERHAFQAINLSPNNYSFCKPGKQSS